MAGAGPYDDVALADEEKVRRLVLHVGVPRTICTLDRANEATTEAELNRVLAEMAWGSVDRGTGVWTPRFEEPRLDQPETGLISYLEWLQREFPTGKEVEDVARYDNAHQIRDRAARFTAANEPGQPFKPLFDQMVRSLTLPKNVMKGLGLTKVTLDESSLPEDVTGDEAANAVRFGRYQFLPSFFNLLIALQKEKRKFSLVFHSFKEEELNVVQKEMGMFCEGRHPCYNGQFKTKKVLMTGEKGNKDLRMQVNYQGIMDRMGDTLTFKDRNSIRKEEKPEGEENNTFGDSVDDGLPEQTFAPTVYKGNAPIYAGMLCEILEETSCVGILDDHEYWKETKDEAPDAGKIVYVDDGETKVQHLFFDGNIRSSHTYSVDIRDAVTEKPVPHEEAKDVYFHQVDLVQAITDPEYYIKALQQCEAKHLERIVAQKREKAPWIETSDTLSRDELLKLDPKEYLYQTVMPGLVPALELCQRDRPADPISFIAFQLLRHPFTYQKSLKEEVPPPAITG